MRFKQLGAVFVSVLLVVAAGSVVALPATDAGSDAIEETQEAIQQQGNETANETNDTAGNETDNVTNETGEASVTFENQSSNGTAVRVQNATVPEGGFVVVHLSENGTPGEVIGASSFLDAGSHENVSVELYNVTGANFTQSELAEDQSLVAMLHRDTNDNQSYDFTATNGSEDGPYTANGSAVIDEGFVTVETGMTGNETNATAGNETNATAGNETNVTVGNETNVTAGDETNATADNQTAGAAGDETNATAGNETNVTAGNETDATAGNETDATAGNETNVTAGNETNVTDNQTDAQAGTDVTDQLNTSGNASLIVQNQSSDGTSVIVHGVYLADGGFVEVTDENGFAVGSSEYLEAGVHGNVEVSLNQSLAGNETITVFALRDANGNQQYDGTGVENDSDEVYVNANGTAVTADALVTVTDGQAATADETADNATAGNETNATAGNETDATANQTGNATDNASVAADLSGDGDVSDDGNVSDNETDDEVNVTTDDETNATAGNETGETDEMVTESSENASITVLAAQTVAGNGTSLNVSNVSADVRYYLEVRASGIIYNTTLAFQPNETFSGALVLQPEIKSGNTTVFNVSVHAAENASVLVSVNVTYTAAEETANATANETANATANETANATANETAETTEETNETAEAGNETMAGNETNATAGNETNVTVGNETMENATVTFEEQTSNGTAVVVKNATLPEGGFVVVHDDTLFEGDALGSVVGVSDYLEAGTHENVTVTLFTNATYGSTEILVAMPHQDTNDNQTYEFVASNGTEDGPYLANGTAVMDNTTVTFETAAGNATAGNATAGNATESNESDDGDY